MTAIHPSPQAAQGRDAASATFAIVDKPGLLTILFGDQPIIQFVNEHAYFRTFRIDNVVFRPGGPVELIGIVPSAVYPGPQLLACHWDCRKIGANIVEIVLTPSKLEDGLDRLASEKRTIRIEYLPAKDRFVYTINVDLRFHADIKGGEGLHHTAMAQWPGDDYAVIEFDDPLLSGGLGPQVPMTQDWQGLHEPVLSADGYTTAWHKRYFDVTLDTVVRGMRKITFNREVNGVQKFFNRTMPVTKPGRPFIYRGLGNKWLRMTPLFDYPASHHICEWGFDMHFYAMLPKAGNGVLFKAGQHVSLSYAMEVIDTPEVPRDYLSAKDAEIEPNERALCDVPFYEEPACRLTGSILDAPDAYGWDSNGACSWNRAGGHAAGFGSLEIAHGEAPKESSWSFCHWGPSYACNPVPPLSRYEISAWIKAAELDHVSLKMEMVAYGGPAMTSARSSQTYKDDGRKVIEKRGEWVHVLFAAGPTASFVLSGTFTFAYKGKGSAAMSGLSIRRV